MKVSVIIPIYKVEEYLRECVDSVISQTYSNIEIILVDDGSPDACPRICDEYASKDERVVVIHKENGGVSSARNAGIKRASGEYLMFLDGDDWLKNKYAIEIISSRIKLTNPDVLSFNFEKVYDSGKRIVYFSKQKSMPVNIDTEDSLKYIKKNDIWISSACNKVIKHEFFSSGEIYFRHGITSEDIDWSLRLLICTKINDFISDVIFCYRQRNESLSNKISAKKVEVLIKNIEFCLEFEKKTFDNKKNLIRSYISYQYGTLLANISTIDDNEKKRSLVEYAGKYQFLLKWSYNKKIVLLRLAIMLFGFQRVFSLLKWNYSK